MKTIITILLTAGTLVHAAGSVLTLPGLVADREKKEVVLQARATGIEYGEPVEFVLVSPESGRDYEAVAISASKPSDIHKALEFIGLTPGRGISHNEMLFWPRGPAVEIFCRWKAAKPDMGEAGEMMVPIKEMLFHLEEQTVWPESGFFFTGSYTVTNKPGKGPETAYGADVHDPNSIISTYNQAVSVLDVSEQALQSEIYGAITCSSTHVFKADAPLEFVLRPAAAGQREIKDFTLRVGRKKKREGTTIDQLTFQLLDVDGKVLNKRNTLTRILAQFNEVTEKNNFPYLTVDFDGALPVEGVRAVCEFLLSIEGNKGIRIMPPPKGQLYYKSFLPDPIWYSRENRYAYPWELRLARNGRKISGQLLEVSDHWPEGSMKPELSITTHPVGSVKAFVKLTETLKQSMPILLIYGDKSMSYETIMEYVNPVRGKLPTVYVFTGKKSAGKKND